MHPRLAANKAFLIHAHELSFVITAAGIPAGDYESWEELLAENDIRAEFAESLSLADEVILTDIYPARELPIEGVSSRLIYDCLPAELEKWLCHKAELPDFLKDRKAKLQTLVVLGAGDLEQFLTSEKLFLA